jgi:hypothetical protein
VERLWKRAVKGARFSSLKNFDDLVTDSNSMEAVPRGLSGFKVERGTDKQRSIKTPGIGEQ